LVRETLESAGQPPGEPVKTPSLAIPTLLALADEVIE
jgi:hypothetical protein